nr:MAG TPA: hypothetical protein [Caudoviricetes sp.]
MMPLPTALLTNHLNHTRPGGHEGRKDLPCCASQKQNTTASATTTNPPIRITKVITQNGLDAVVHFFPDTVLSYSSKVSALKLFNLPPGSCTRGGRYKLKNHPQKFIRHFGVISLDNTPKWRYNRDNKKRYRTPTNNIKSRRKSS